MKIHPDVAAAHAQFGGDLLDMQQRYDSYDELLDFAKEVESYFQGIDRGNGITNPARITARKIINRYGSEQDKRQYAGGRG